MPVGKNAGRKEERSREEADREYRNKRFVVIIERGNSGVPMFMVDENEKPERFATAAEARRNARGAMWENTWVWWIAEFTDEGLVRLGTEID